MTAAKYPVVKRRLFHRRFRRILLLIFIAAFAACGIVNICVGGTPWSLYVLGGEILAWWLLMGMPLIERGWLDAATAALLGTAAYLLLLDLCGNMGGFSIFVAEILIFSLLIVQGILFFVFFLRGRVNAVPMYLMIVAGLLFTFGALLDFWPMDWPLIVIGSLSLGLLIISFIIYRKRLIRDWHRRFHI